MVDKSGGSGRPSLLGVAVLFEFSLVLIATGLGWLLGVNPFRDLAWSAPRQLIDELLLGALAALPMLAAFYWARKSSWGPLGDLRQLIDDHLLHHFVGATPLGLAWLALAAGFGEEVLFRGCLQQALDVYLEPSAMRGYLPLLLASVLFGLAHFANWTYLVLATLVGLYLGGLLMTTESLWPPIVAHALYDFIAIRCLRNDYEKKRAA